MDSKEYLDSLNTVYFDSVEQEIHDFARSNGIPIIQDEGLAFLRQITRIKNPKRILEIGTAVGFSAINMAKSSDAQITTIEIDPEMYKLAIENIHNLQLDDRINVILSDALLVDLQEKYDMIFIDAAKAQYIKFFEKFSTNLEKHGLIVTDNLVFHGLVTEEIHSRNLRQLVGKIKKYNSWLMENKDFDTYIYGVGDGIALSIKK